jgi:hypothetical protein
MKKQTITIKVNFNNLKSIEKGEKEKADLENRGYKQISFKPYGYDKFNLVYEKEMV